MAEGDEAHSKTGRERAGEGTVCRSSKQQVPTRIGSGSEFLPGRGAGQENRRRGKGNKDGGQAGRQAGRQACGYDRNRQRDTLRRTLQQQREAGRCHLQRQEKHEVTDRQTDILQARRGQRETTGRQAAEAAAQADPQLEGGPSVCTRMRNEKRGRGEGECEVQRRTC